jgi:hypothetical protein
MELSVLGVCVYSRPQHCHGETDVRGRDGGIRCDRDDLRRHICVEHGDDHDGMALVKHEAVLVMSGASPYVGLHCSAILIRGYGTGHAKCELMQASPNQSRSRSNEIKYLRDRHQISQKSLP